MVYYRRFGRRGIGYGYGLGRGYGYGLGRGYGPGFGPWCPWGYGMPGFRAPTPEDEIGFLEGNITDLKAELEYAEKELERLKGTQK